MKKVNKVIEMGEPFLVHIPDSPFPARSLVHGLALLLQLGKVRVSSLIGSKNDNSV
jgi:hypothetical protein